MLGTAEQYSSQRAMQSTAILARFRWLLALLLWPLVRVAMSLLPAALVLLVAMY